MGAQGDYDQYEGGSGGAAHSAWFSFDARGTCALRGRNSPTDYVFRDELPSVKDLIVSKARIRLRAAARSARVADGGDVANEAAGERAGLLCGGGHTCGRPRRVLPNVERPASDSAEPLSEAPAIGEISLFTRRTTCLCFGFAVDPDEAKTEAAFVLTPSGVKEVQRGEGRRLKRECRTARRYNFSRPGGAKVKTLVNPEEAAGGMAYEKWGISNAYVVQYVRRTWWCGNNATGGSNVTQETTEEGAGERGSIFGRSFRTYILSA